MNKDLPEGWIWSTLGEISTKPQYGWTTKAKHVSGTILLLRTTDISKGAINWENVPYCTEEPENLADYLLEENDIVISRAGSIGISYLLKNIPKPTIFASYLIRFHPLENMEARYIAYYLHTSAYWKRIEEESSGIALANVNASKLETIEIPLAPTNEQSRIVAAIEQQFSRLDSAVAELKAAQADVKQYRTSLLTSAVEGELTKEWRAANPASETGAQLLARILIERRARWETKQLAKMRAKGIAPKDEKWKLAYKEPQEPNVWNLPELPEGWCWAAVEQLADVGTGATPLKSRGDYYTRGTIPWITSGATNNHFIDAAEEFITEKALMETNVKVFPARSLILAMYGEGKTRGRVSELRIDAATNQACAAIVFRPLSIICQPYVKYFLLSHYLELRSGAVGGVQPNLNLTIVKETQLPLPPLAEQAQIVAEIEARLAEIAETEEMIEQSLQWIEGERQHILQAAFTGQLMEQDPEDEPASVLLERIREERILREEADKARRKGERKMHKTKKRLPYQAGGGELYRTLRAAERPLEPHELFQQAGLKAEDQPEAVALFYSDLARLAAPEIAAIDVERPDERKVLLTVREVAPEIEQELLQEAEDVEEEELEKAEEAKAKPVIETPSLLDLIEE